jgi:hypothetical protein
LVCLLEVKSHLLSISKPTGPERRNPKVIILEQKATTYVVCEINLYNMVVINVDSL